MNAPATPTAGQHGLGAPLQGTPAQPWDGRLVIAAPLELHAPTVQAQWVDYNGHMSESCYLLVFGDQSDAFFRYIGIDEAYRQAGHSLYTVQTMMHNLREVGLGAPLRLTLQLLAADDRRLQLFHSMYHGATGALLATGEQLLVHVDMQQARSTPMPRWLLERVLAIVRAHRVLPYPARAGASICLHPRA